jgi:hypothetical protein
MKHQDADGRDLGGEVGIGEEKLGDKVTCVPIAGRDADFAAHVATVYARVDGCSSQRCGVVLSRCCARKEQPQLNMPNYSDVAWSLRRLTTRQTRLLVLKMR